LFNSGPNDGNHALPKSLDWDQGAIKEQKGKNIAVKQLEVLDGDDKRFLIINASS